jgi:hypothetical protein
VFASARDILELNLIHHKEAYHLRDALTILTLDVSAELSKFALTPRIALTISSYCSCVIPTTRYFDHWAIDKAVNKLRSIIEVQIWVLSATDT